MKKSKTFQTLAEALEAGEPPMLDKITGNLKNEFFKFCWIDVYGDVLKVENVFKTLSGKTVIIARQKTKEEEEAENGLSQQRRLSKEKAEQERIKKAIDLPGYILIGWKTEGITRLNDSTAYYLQTTGPRHYYSRDFNFTWEECDNGSFIKSAKIDPWQKDIMTRKGREKLASRIKEAPDDYTLCAPLWLLTSIPDPRPRFLAGEE